MHAFLGLKSYKIEENLHKNSKHHSILFTFKNGLMLIFLKQSISAAELIIAIM